jgi:ABC-type amino acid transport substrate-binding protein
VLGLLRVFVAFVVLTVGATAPAAAPPTSADPTSEAHAPVLTVAVKSAPPFAVKQANGEWTGVSIELWRRIAERLALRYRFEEVTLSDMLDGLESGRFDAAVAALTVTAEREQRFDFTHPFETSGLGIAVLRERSPLWATIAAALYSWDFFQLVLFLGVCQLIVGFAMWLIERRDAAGQFPPTPLEGIGTGIWWAVVTMTTVGYGDKAPRTWLGRTLALAWMLCSVILVSAFTASVASMLTIRQLEAQIAAPGDLARFRIAAVPKTTAETWLRRADFDFADYPTPVFALEALVRGDVEVVVYDRPILEYLVREGAFVGAERVEVLDVSFQRQDYAIGIPTDSPLRERINAVLPDLVE